MENDRPRPWLLPAGLVSLGFCVQLIGMGLIAYFGEGMGKTRESAMLAREFLSVVFFGSIFAGGVGLGCLFAYAVDRKRI